MPANLKTITAQDIALWPTPDYANAHGERRPWLSAFSLAWLGASTLLVFMRIALRVRKQGGGLGWDDAFLIPSWLFLIGFTTCIVWAVEADIITRHIWDVPLMKLASDGLNAWIGQLLFLLGTGCIKISVLCFYRRLVQGTYRPIWKWATWAAIAFTVIYNLTFFLTLIFNCHPVSAYWKNVDPIWASTHEWSCFDSKASNYLVGSFAVISDIYALFLPWGMTWNLEMPRKQKIGLNAIFSVGIVSIIAAGLRTRTLVKMGEESDLTWVGFWLYVWAVVEWNLGIICACAPSLRVLFRSYLKTTFNRSKPSKHSHTSSQGGGKKSFGCCGKQGAASSDDPPARAIELKRSVTIESDTPFAAQDNKPYFRESIKTTTTSISDAGSNRIGIVYHPRTYHQTISKEPYTEDIEAARPRQDSYDPIASQPAWSKSTTSIQTECHSCRAKARQGSAQRTFFRSNSDETLAKALNQAGHHTPPLPPLPVTALPPMLSTGSEARADSRMRSPNHRAGTQSRSSHDDSPVKMATAEEEDDPMRPDSVMLAMMGRGRF